MYRILVIDVSVSMATTVYRHVAMATLLCMLSIIDSYGNILLLNLCVYIYLIIFSLSPNELEKYCIKIKVKEILPRESYISQLKVDGNDTRRLAEVSGTIARVTWCARHQSNRATHNVWSHAGYVRTMFIG